MIVLKDFFINFSILCTGIFLIHQYFHREKVLSMSTIRRRILEGFLNGLFGVLLMDFGIHLKDGVLIDLRSIPIMVAAQVGGWVSTLVATVIIIIGRLTLYPISHSSLVNVVVLTLSAISFSIICHSRIKRERKWLIMAVSFVGIITLTIHFVIPEWWNAFSILIQYAFAIACGTFTTHLLTSFLWRSQDKYEELKRFAQKDYLTGLNNARSFDKAIRFAFSKATEHQEELSLLIIDIDYFKQVNDVYGHPAGDKVLKRIGQILTRLCRSVDIASRNGGEEFSIIMPACDSASARKVAERIRKAVEQSEFLVNSKTTLKITVSIGYSTTDQKDINSVAQLINQTDEALYIAKRTGRNRISSYYARKIPMG